MTGTLGNILALDDDKDFLIELKAALEADFNIKTVASIPDAMKFINQYRPDIFLLDMNLPEVSGLQVLKVIKQRTSDLPIIMLTGESKPATIVSAIQSGASDYIVKGSEDFILSLKLRITKLLSLKGIKEQNEILKLKIREADSKYEIMGISTATIKLRSEIQKFKGTSAYVLIMGENGTGKELVARNLNIQEGQASRPFVAINCGAIPTNLFESELFGHVKGAFTGASHDQTGKFVAANGGDIFLDEIGEMPLEMQVKLLRVLQEKVVTPVGSNKPISLNVRVIAATNKKLEELVQEGRFRQDLFFRLNQVTLKTTSLKDRPEDILFLARAFAKRNLPGVMLSKESQKLLENHLWPGNIRELANTIERACFLVRGSGSLKIQPEHLMLVNLTPASGVSIPSYLLPKNEIEVSRKKYQQCMGWIQKVFLEKSLDLLKNDNTELISRLEISKSFYYQKKKELGVSQKAEEGIL